MNTGSQIPPSKNLINTIAWTIGGRTEYALEGSVFIGGAAVQWLRDGLGIIRSAAETETLASGLASNDDVYFVPALVGLGAPYWDPAARGAILGVTRGTTPAHLARAALEAICFQTKDVLLEMERASRRCMKMLHVDGGAAANNFLMQLQADILGCAVERPGVIETTALGAAGLAGLAVGFWKDRGDFLRHRTTERVFRPKLGVRERTRLYARWKEAVKRALKWHSA
jgi:glycerol kinase